MSEKAPTSPKPAREGQPAREGSHALLVASGIFLSRIAGLVRQKAMAHYLGSAAAADAFNAAFRIPNLLQNLFGDGALSASFIPVYAGLLAKEDREAADRVAGAVGTALALICAVLVAAGVLGAPYLVWAIAPGFTGPTQDLTVHLVRILFPGAGLLAMSAWCLGILNSHRKFLMSYAAPVVWNFAMIAALLGLGPHQSTEDLAVTVAIASVVGSALQFGVQLPVVWKLAPGIRPLLNLADANVRTTARNFGPAFFGRGVMQISSYIDSVLASLLPIGSVAIFGYAQALYTLPVSLFGMSVSAAELPAMSSVIGSEAEVAEWLRGRLAGGLRRIAYFVIPSAAAFVLLGDTIAAGLFQSGQFDRSDSLRVWAALAGSSVGLLAQTWARLYSSTWYALKDTRTPLRIAFIRVVLTTALGWMMAVQAPVWLGIDSQWGVAGLTASAGIAGWVEYILLRRALEARIGKTGIDAGIVMRLWGAAAVAGVAGVLVKLATTPLHPILAATLTCGVFGTIYLASTAAMGMEEVRPILRKLRIRR